jgi:transposase-like protein
MKKRRLTLFDFKKKLRKNMTLRTQSKMSSSDIKPVSNVSKKEVKEVIAQEKKLEATNEIEKTADMIHQDVASAVATLRLWLNQDKLH